MSNYEFIVVLKHAPAPTEGLADKLFAAGCDGGTPRMCNGLPVIDFHRAAASLEEAIRSAVDEINSAGCLAAHV